MQAAAGATLGRVRDVGTSKDAFALHRSLLFTVAYEMLGSRSDAEDVVQETWLRCRGGPRVGARPARLPGRIVTRQALNRLRSLARRREEYVGEWLPEPLLTSPDIAADVELAESVSIAMLTVLETLGPAERAVFVLREVFETPYEEIADAVANHPPPSGRSPTGLGNTSPLGAPACRSARRSSRRPWSGSSLPSDRATCKASSTSWPTAAASWRLLVVRSRARNAWPASSSAVPARQTSTKPVWLNGSLGVQIDIGGAMNTAVSFSIENGRITRIYAIRNPHKLAWLDVVAALTRS